MGRGHRKEKKQLLQHSGECVEKLPVWVRSCMSSGASVQGVADSQQGVPHKMYGEDSKFDRGG